jgi:2-keto-3-deoxy-L-rhamnonate aldolase RhmA
MRGKELQQALTSGRVVYGTCLVGYRQPVWPKMFAQAGLDFVFLESEHTPLNRETIAWVAQAYGANGVAPLLRIPEPSPTEAAMALDAGAHGIIVPYVETVEQAKAMVGAVKYRPLKGAALQKVLNENKFPNEETATYLRDFNPDAVLIIMIESPAGVENLPALLATGGVDAVLIGPHDFSVSHGVPEAYDHPIFNEAAKKVVQTCREHHVGVGIHWLNADLNVQMRWIEEGCNFIVHASDAMFIVRGLRQDIGQLKKMLTGDTVDREGDNTSDGSVSVII